MGTVSAHFGPSQQDGNIDKGIICGESEVDVSVHIAAIETSGNIARAWLLAVICVYVGINFARNIHRQYTQIDSSSAIIVRWCLSRKG